MVGAQWDVPTLIDVCKKTGVAGVELRTTHKHGVEPTLSADARKDVRKRFEDAGVVPWCLGSTCEFHSPDPAVVNKNIETCKQFVQLAADAGFKGVKVRPNGLRKDVPAEKTLEQIGKALIPCGEAGEAAGVGIWVEVHGHETQRAGNIKQVMEHCGHKNVALVWNSNPEDVKNGSVVESFNMLWPWVRSCHINDLTNDKAGKYPYRDLFKKLRGIGYDRYTMCEVPRSPVDVAAGEDFLRYYKALWHELSHG
jgi:sugar phosphate isomerase/epimerase